MSVDLLINFERCILIAVKCNFGASNDWQHGKFVENLIIVLYNCDSVRCDICAATLYFL